MTISSVVSWELTRDDIIKSALRKCGVLAKGQTPSTEDYSDCAVALNALIQTLATEGMPLWKRTTDVVTMVAGTQSYTINNIWDVVQIVLLPAAGGAAIELTGKSLYDFNRLPTNSTGSPVHYVYTPGIENGTVTLWPTPDASTASVKRLHVVYQKEFFAFDASTDTPDFPAYWTEALIYGLASRVAPEYGTPLQDRQMLEVAFEKAKKSAEGYGDENDSSWYFQPDRRR